MTIVTLDFETYYDREYSLKKLTTEQYINDSRFQIITVGVKIGTAPAHWVSFEKTEDYASYLRFLPDCMVLAHNALFDGAILSWRLGLRPKFLFDTLSLARAVLGTENDLSLKALSAMFGIGEKGDEVVRAEGKRREDFSQEELEAYGRYCVNDVELTYRLFGELAKGFPRDELRIIDMTLRMFTEPVFELDMPTLQQALELELAKKEELLRRLNDVEASDLRSNDKFAAVLRGLGVEPPTKFSNKLKDEHGNPKRVWAFAKNDADFKALLQHENPLVVAAVEARLGHKSTQQETRAKRFLGIANRMKKLPVPLAYYSAHTGRYGGTDGINLQNLPRVNKKDSNSGLLRKAIKAPPGHVIVVADAAQIEARLAFWQANQKDKVEAFAQGRDIYSEQASIIYGRKIDYENNPDDFIPRFIGKAVTLGCIYGLGHFKFGNLIYVGMLGGPGVLFDETVADQFGVDPGRYETWLNKYEQRMMAFEQSCPLGVDKNAWLVHMACAKHTIDTFRRDNPEIVSYWEIAAGALEAMYSGHSYYFGGPNEDLLQVLDCNIVLPNGLQLRYPDLQWDEGQNQYSCLRRKEGRVQRVKLYGGGIVENVTQALANLHIRSVMLKAWSAGYKVALQVHDEVVCVVKESEVEKARDDIERWMCTPPPWAPTLPLSASCGFAYSYGNAKS